MQIRSVSVFMAETASVPEVWSSGVSKAPFSITPPNSWIRIIGTNR